MLEAIPLDQHCKAYLAYGEQLCRLARLRVCSGAKEGVMKNSSVLSQVSMLLFQEYNNLVQR